MLILSVPNEGYSRNMSCTLNLISTFLFHWDMSSQKHNICTRMAVVTNYIQYLGTSIVILPEGTKNCFELFFLCKWKLFEKFTMQSNDYSALRFLKTAIVLLPSYLYKFYFKTLLKQLTKGFATRWIIVYLYFW